MIRVAGRVFRQTLEADGNLAFTYAWDKRNVYNQKVYGVVQAEVAVGYSYVGENSQCSRHPIWVTKTTRMKGFDVDISDIGGGWNLGIHHHYNSDQGRNSFYTNCLFNVCLLYTSPSPRDRQKSRMPSSA